MNLSKLIAVRGFGLLIGALLGIALGLALAVFLLLRGSLPQLDGEQRVEGIGGRVAITRDDRGRVRISAVERNDVAFGLGYAHAQDRFFQMDLLRRQAAGEMAELLGPALVGYDRSRRWHQFREKADREWKNLPVAQRLLVEAYARGVNAGLHALRVRPFEYLLLRTAPLDWSPADTLLVIYAFYLTLHDSTVAYDRINGLLREAFDDRMVGFLTGNGSAWSSPLEGEDRPILSFPISISSGRSDRVDRPETTERPLPVGSNAWAVGGDLATGTGALVANDMHLGLMMPPVWYLAGWEVTDPDTSEVLSVHGLTLAGTPALITGGNGLVAWGFTSAYADTQDLVRIETLPGGESYQTPDGPRLFERVREEIRIRGGESETLEITRTIWGPLIPDTVGEAMALRWIAHDPGAVDIAMVALERARSVEEALRVARTTGLPSENIVVGDREGKVGWTIAGPLPERFGFAGDLPVSFADGSAGWRGFLDADRVPEIIRGRDGRIWSANEAQVSGPGSLLIGNSGQRSRGRAWTIRERLEATDHFGPEDFLNLQLDTRVPDLDRWCKLMIALIDDKAVVEQPELGPVRALLEVWDGHATIDSQAYPLIRSFQGRAEADVLDQLLTPVGIDRRSYAQVFDFGESLYGIVSTQPAGLLKAGHEGWRSRMLDWLDACLDGRSVEELPTWGESNPIRIRHPLSQAVSALSRFLDGPTFPGSGDGNAVKVLSRSHGAVARMVIPVGSEEQGLLQLSGGQSGHPLSGFYRSDLQDWISGTPVSFLPGPVVHRLILVPQP